MARLSLAELKAKANVINAGKALESIKGGTLNNCHNGKPTTTSPTSTTNDGF
jgi:hypothetical protein